MTDPPRFEVDDAIVLLLGAPARSPTLRDRISGVTRIEKLFFLLDVETPIGSRLTEVAGFVPHNFGPFSAAVYQAVETLEAAGLISDSASLPASAEDSWESDELIDDLPGNRFHNPRLRTHRKGTSVLQGLAPRLATGY